MTRIAFEEIRKNNIKTWFLIILFIVMIGGIGAALGLYYGDMYFGLAIAGIFAIFYSVIMFFQGKNMILSMTGAVEAPRSKYSSLHNIVEELSIAAGIPKPKVFVINDSALNAFATGRDPKHAAVTVTTGLIERMDNEELRGVIAHELSHIKNYDIRVMMLAAVLVGLTTLLSDFFLRSIIYSRGGRRSGSRENGSGIFIIIGIVLALLSPLVAQLIKLAISRKREFMADAGGAMITRYPKGLASALRKIKNDPDPLVDRANKATAHLFISTPFRNRRGFFTGLFSTHPPIDERIRRLEEM